MEIRFWLRQEVTYLCGHPGMVEMSGGEFGDCMRKLEYLQSHSVCGACHKRRSAAEMGAGLEFQEHPWRLTRSMR